MDKEAVSEFLGCVPLLQRLPGLSVKKIADLVRFQHYETGDYVIQEGRAGDGIYFIWDGEAEVYGPGNPEERSRSEYQLKRYDYFGHGGLNANFVEQTNVIALSKLTCLVLANEHCHLLQPKTIWNADGTSSLVENILHVESVEVDLFKGITLPDAPKFGKVFGGQLVGQALAAASKSVDCFKLVHSLHAYFQLIGNFDIPILYRVNRLRDGKSFATRQVEAIQKGNIIFTLIASFQKDEVGFEHQEVAMPSVPDPETLLSMEELRERRLTDPRLPRSYRNKVAKASFVPWPIEIRFCEPTNNTNQTKSPSSLRYWFRARGGLSDDQALHRCVVAYASDLIFLSVSVNPHRSPGSNISSVSLDHAMWFHRSLKADDWILFVISSPIGQSARGFVTGQMFNRKGELIVSLTQEGLLRKPRGPSMISNTSKL
ncbi:unnamed protein product [Rhodiola kirilowii]